MRGRVKISTRVAIAVPVDEIHAVCNHVIWPNSDVLSRMCVSTLLSLTLPSFEFTTNLENHARSISCKLYSFNNFWSIRILNFYQKSFQSASLDDLQIRSNDLFAWTVSSRSKAEQVNELYPYDLDLSVIESKYVATLCLNFMITGFPLINLIQEIIFNQAIWPWLMFSNGFSFFFSKNSLNLANRFQPNFRETSETVPDFWIFVCGGQEGQKTPQKSEISDIGVQSFDHNSETNQVIKNRNSSLASSINS